MSECIMSICPDRKGFFLKRYWYVCLLSIVLFLAGFWMIFSFSIEFAILAWLAAIGLMGLAIVHTILHIRATSLSLFEKELVYETGILHHYKKRVLISRITDSSTYRTLMDKMIGIGALRVNTSGMSVYEVIANDFEYGDVEKIQSKLYELMKMQQHKPEQHKKEKGN